MNGTRQPRRLRRRLLAAGACLLALSALSGAADFFLVLDGRQPALSTLTAARKDGGTTEHIGLGYSLVSYRRWGGEQGPEIVFWWCPVPISRTHIAEAPDRRWSAEHTRP